MINPYLLKNSEEIPLLKVTKLKFAIEYRSKRFIFFFNLIKLFFSICSGLYLHVYTETLQSIDRSDLGVVQKWVQGLIGLLVCFDDPLCIIGNWFGILYYICQGFMESLFISMLLLFWLIVMHTMSMSNVKGQVDISSDKFFRPKVALCFCYLI